MRQLPSGTVTFLFTDIEGSTRLLEELGDRYAAALAEHRRVIREALATYSGIEVDTQGDAFFVAFGRAIDAVEAAREAQRALDSGPIRVRMGVHTGEPQLTAEGYVGMDVHKAARIAAAGHGGQVLVSNTTHDLLPDGLVLRDLGEHRLKDLSTPQRLYQIGEEDFPPLKALNETNLPTQPTDFIGRERELSEIVELVRSSRLVTLTGPGGSGKTRLALQAAAELAGEYEDGVWFVPLAPVEDGKLIGAAIAKALGARGKLEPHLQGKQTLLVLDNFEHLLEAAPVVGDLLAGANGVRVLVTSRGRLGLSAEQEYSVPTLATEDAVSLFQARAPSRSNGFEADAVVSEICDRLDRLPLAIELAAARAKLLTTTQILERLGRRLELLTGGARDAPERHQTLRGTIEWSYELLDEDERALFARLAVFGGSFSIEAAEAIVEADLDALASLVDKSLLRETGQGRFFMLETLKEFAAERLQAGGEEGEFRLRHADWALQLAEEAEPQLEGRNELALWLDSLELERDNLRTASTTLREVNRGGDALRLATALWRLWFARGPIAEGARIVETALESAPAAPSADRVRGLWALGNFHSAAGDLGSGTALYEQALAMSRRIGAKSEEARVLLALSASASAREELAHAKRQAESGVRLAKERGELRTAAAGTAMLGVLAIHDEDYVGALALFEESIAAMGGEDFGTVVNLINIALASFRLGDLSEAAARLRESLTMSLRLRDHVSATHGLEVVAAVLAARADVSLAARILGASAALREEEGLSLQELEAELHAETEQLVRESLGADSYSREYEAGRVPDLGEMIEAAIVGLE
jgi:predicted ATPase